MSLQDQVTEAVAKLADLQASIADEKAQVEAKIKSDIAVAIAPLETKIAELQAAIDAGVPTVNLQPLLDGIDAATQSVKAIVDPTV